MTRWSEESRPWMVILHEVIFLAIAVGIFSLAFILLSLAVHGRVNW